MIKKLIEDIGNESEDLVNTEMYYNNGNFGIAYDIVRSENNGNEFKNKMKKSHSKIIYSLEISVEPTYESIKNEGVIVRDSGAIVSAFKDLSLFTNGVWEADRHIFISGVQNNNDPIKITKVCSN